MASIHNIEIKYEWFESANEGDLEEKENISEPESEDQNVYNLCCINAGFNDYNANSYFSSHKNFLDFNPNIQLPPPKA